MLRWLGWFVLGALVVVVLAVAGLLSDDQPPREWAGR